MTSSLRSLLFIALTTLSLASTGLLNMASAATAQDLDQDSRHALQILYKTNPVAETMSRTAKAVLVFPKVIKAGLVFGGSYGEGVMFKGSKVENYYNTVTGSWGLQAGAQAYAYAVFLMTDKAIDYVHKTKGWEIGVGPTVVLVDQGLAKNLSSSTLKDDAYAFVFDQEGLMAGVSIEGTKISLIKR
ncbi:MULTISPECIES: YSC84-related protein [unclassified Pseudomonas]|uniref:lipid-binding SYLF domain-containing protein n=1 Tax=unclassified Pseudomonas TaxID=196821 RepID=UPI000CD257D6|nr:MULTISPECIES: YSC84-related protein [unclassified Pseudomonas]POA35796.1 twin-arginine translocation pathway signal protein [Pseudomonas sp. GW456-R21]POA71623.1 twin-arginine translocation pathway signal protein [Pseudomonas sp. GW460-R15]